MLLIPSLGAGTFSWTLSLGSRVTGYRGSSSTARTFISGAPERLRFLLYSKDSIVPVHYRRLRFKNSTIWPPVEICKICKTNPRGKCFQSFFRGVDGILIAAPKFGSKLSRNKPHLQRWLCAVILRLLCEHIKGRLCFHFYVPILCQSISSPINSS
ncbi:hypothetical protein BDZ97DRAFT_1814262 [Flammula alnicola]|nr:hypothetical protein BDZ97DRAFT_1814262 [Flammula alnicola]